ncbi:hypothetical protein SADUNF_Sadunf07G0067800 [Salix dunnii]|uniref:Uncharacterized protein n=1 Tax=Salix dunnii TaxID=1413687 RepID=A0A835K0L2_9ROSI|nr:hypothetical protein SADUNF_Sadunf07G0067800 [Salix dunnii]
MEEPMYGNNSEKETVLRNVACMNVFKGKSFKLGVIQDQILLMKNSKLHEIDSRAICALPRQVLSDMKMFLRRQLELMGERMEVLPFSSNKATVVFVGHSRQWQPWKESISQQLGEDQGCNGGLMNHAVVFIKHNN